jgi:competence protein ComEC
MVCLAFAAGIFLGRHVNQQVGMLIFGFFTAVLTLSFGNRLLLAISLCGLVFLGGVVWLRIHDHPAQVADFYGRTLSVSGVIFEEPDERPDKTLLTVARLQIAGKDISGKIMVFADKYPEFFYGDAINLTGRIQEPAEAEGGDKFSYKDYLSRFGIDAVSYYPALEKTGQGRGNPIKLHILEFKKIFLGKLSRLIPEPANGLLAGILVGAKRGMPKRLLDEFAATGTSHIIAVSGFNITVIAQVLDRMLSRFGRRIAFVLALAGIGLFVVLTGASASVVRAAIMGSLVLLAQNVGRLFLVDNALALTAAIMLLANPKILRFDVGFQLSFLALAGLVYLSPMLEAWFSRCPRWFKKYSLPTVAAQILTLPVIIYNFDRVSLVAPIVNLLVLPLVPWIMLAGFLTGALGLAVFPAAKILSWPTTMLLSLMIKTIEAGSGLPWAAVKLASGPVFVLVYYAVLAGVLVLYNKRYARAH